VSFKRLLRFVVKVGVSFVIINTLFYFVELPLWKEIGDNQAWHGRISAGYPTADVVTLAYVLIMLLFFDELGINQNKRILYACLLFTGMVLQFSGTGTVLLTCILCGVLFLCFFGSQVSWKKNVIKFVLLLPVFLVSGYSALKEYDPILLEKSLLLIENKTSILLGEDPSMNTLKLRENQYEQSLRYQESDIKKLFGIGFERVSFNLEVLQDPTYVHIEDQYFFNKTVYGYIGAILFILFIAMSFWKAFTLKNISLSTKIFYCLLVLTFATDSKTGVSFYGFSTTVVFALFYAILLRQKNGKLI
jgi:hypothetical protein